MNTPVLAFQFDAAFTGYCFHSTLLPPVLAFQFDAAFTAGPGTFARLDPVLAFQFDAAFTRFVATLLLRLLCGRFFAEKSRSPTFRTTTSIPFS